LSRNRIHNNPQIDPSNRATWPRLLREQDICKNPKRNYPGILPLTQTPFRDAVARGAIEPPTKFGTRINTWDSDYIARLQRDGIPDLKGPNPPAPTPALPQDTTHKQGSSQHATVRESVHQPERQRRL
jgi:hypothetical protein